MKSIGFCKGYTNNYTNNQIRKASKKRKNYNRERKQNKISIWAKIYQNIVESPRKLPGEEEKGKGKGKIYKRKRQKGAENNDPIPTEWV